MCMGWCGWVGFGVGGCWWLVAGCRWVSVGVCVCGYRCLLKVEYVMEGSKS